MAKNIRHEIIFLVIQNIIGSNPQSFGLAEFWIKVFGHGSFLLCCAFLHPFDTRLHFICAELVGINIRQLLQS